MSDFQSTEAFPIFPVLLLIDVSASMHGEPIKAVNDTLPSLKQVVKDDPEVGEIARIGVVTFADKAQTELPLSDIQYAAIPKLDATGPSTDFATGFVKIRHQIEIDIQALGKGARFHTPVIFFISDGQHNAPGGWASAYADLTAKTSKFAPEIVVFGFGDAKAAELKRIATRFCFMATDTDPAAAVKEILRAIIGSIKENSRSLRSGGGFAMPVDPNKFVQLDVRTVE